MVDEVLKALRVFALSKEKAYFIDATLGSGGHSLKIVKRGGFVLGIEADEGLLKVAKKRLEKACPTPERGSRECFKLVNGNFINLDRFAKDVSLQKVDGILFDLGVTSFQLTSPGRGFSFSNPEAPLDMRIDVKAQKVTAADVLNALREDQLTSLFSVVLERRIAEKLARLILEAREKSKFTKVGDFLEVVKKVNELKVGKLNPATKPFLALRIAVNSELENIKIALPKAFDLLRPKGRLAVISFHSAEDRLVKNFFREKEKEGKAKIVTKKPLEPRKDEVDKNPRARSAKLRVLVKKK